MVDPGARLSLGWCAVQYLEQGRVPGVLGGISSGPRYKVDPLRGRL